MSLPIYYITSDNDLSADKFSGNAVAIYKYRTEIINVPKEEIIDRSQGTTKITVIPAYTSQKDEIIISLVKNNDVLTATMVVLKDDELSRILQSYDSTTGKLNLDANNNTYECGNLLERIQDFVMRNDFPYQHCELHFSKDGTALHNITCDMDKVHPIIKEYLLKKNSAEYNLLNLLYKIKESPDFGICNRLIRQGGVPVGFGMRMGTNHETTVERLIEAFHEANGTEYLPSDNFIKSIQDIIRQSDGTDLTAEKQTIWNDFLSFYQSNLGNPDMMPRSVMVEAWATDFMQKNNGQNPFITLSKYRGTGLLGFHFKPTDSMGLLNKFLAGENIPNGLQNLMLGLEIKNQSAPTLAL